MALISGATLSSATIGYIPQIVFVGDSITVGTWDEFTYNGTTYTDVGGFRAALQLLIGKYKKIFVGQYGAVEGTADKWIPWEPGLETNDTDENYLLYPDFQPRHFGWGGRNIATMTEAFIDNEQLPMWFSISNPKNVIVVHLGTNNVDDGIGTEAAAVALLMAFYADIETFDPDISVVSCQIVPNTSTEARDAWVVEFNRLLGIAVTAEQTTNKSLYLIDLYTPLFSGWEAVYSSVDKIHPNHAGYSKIAELLQAKMITEGLL